ncbi:MAG: sensor domain-containing diguanylate cyclase, partial [Pseudomonadales bacterium]
DFCSVTACLVMRGNPDTMEVMVSASRPDTPYVAGETAPRNNQLYCETVIKTQEPLEVANADEDPVWRGNPDTELGLMSYFGVPVNWPSGENFGTFCILDKHSKETTSMEQRFIKRFARVVEDHLRLIELSSKHQYEASHDALTDTFNRRVFTEVGQSQISAALRSKSSLALVVLDIDHFKSVNDSYGHAVGDKVLQAVVDAVRSNLRESDLLARIGGEEFVVLGNVTKTEDPLALAERVRIAVERADTPAAIVGQKITVSCGASELRPGDDLSLLLSRADKALYKAKSSGRNNSKAAP